MNNIFLIGYRCTGKTSVGKELSAKLSYPFIDADEFLVKEDGRSISEIVAQEGWGALRKKEKEIIEKICKLDKYIVSTGGGVVLDKENIIIMKKTGIVVWLKADVATIKKRMISDYNTNNFRPSLTSKKIEDEIIETLTYRIPLYESSMDFFINTDEFTIDEVCRNICQAIHLEHYLK